jgi:two-component system response regulator YesN
MPRPDKSILCVDDEAIILLCMRQELRSRYGGEYACETAIDPEKALEAAADLAADGLRPVLVITDLVMPLMNGDELCRVMKELYPGLKTVLVTGQADYGEVQRILDAGIADAALFKPWSRERLFRAIDECLAGPDPGPPL